MPTESKDESIEIDELEKLLLEAEAEEREHPLGTVTGTIISEPTASAAKKPTPLSLAGSTFLKDLSQEASSSGLVAKSGSKPSSAVHSGDTDSSDDEETRNFLEQKYNEYGKGISTLLKQKDEERVDAQISSFVDRSLKKSDSGVARLALKAAPVKKLEQKEHIVRPLPVARGTIPEVFQKSVYTDPVFGLRIVHPLVSSAVLQERMQGRKPISMARIKSHVEHGDLKEDWAIAGVVLSKSPPKTTSKGGQFSIWKLSDLHGEIKMISLFLFSQAHKDLWKTAEGMVLCILNPGVLDRNEDSKIEAVLSIDKSAKVMILGQSRDMGTCRSRKKNGEKCTSFVNLGQCEYCVYHVKQEYNKACNRGGLISSTAGRGINELRNKVLGKNEVIFDCFFF